MRHLSSSSILLLVVVPACGPSMSSIKAMATENTERNARDATDPDLKEFWTKGAECARKHEMTRTDESSPYSTCVNSFETEMITRLRARAATEKEEAKHTATLRIATCIEITQKKMTVHPYKSLDDCAAHVEVDAKEREQFASANDYEAAEKEGSTKAWLAFLEKHREDRRSTDIVKRLLRTANDAQGDEQAALDDDIVKAYPAAIAALPLERRLLMVGPAGLRVRDIKKMSDAKVANSIALARIRAASAPYKSFDGDELTALKRMGISDDAVTAMIEVSTKLEEKQKADDERKALRAELDALRKLIEEKKASGQPSSGKTVQTKDGPMDVLESCAKRLAAMKLCDQLPFPGSTICSSSVESEFPCPH
jgi:hypothetical protein